MVGLAIFALFHGATSYIFSEMLELILWQLRHSMWKASLIWYMQLGLRALLTFKLCRCYTIYALNIWINQIWEPLSHSIWEQTQVFWFYFFFVMSQEYSVYLCLGRCWSCHSLWTHTDQAEPLDNLALLSILASNRM